MFGNPGSTELPMLRDFPADFRYVLGLQEAVVVGMADGYAQASGGPALVNLHTAPGVGNAMGAIFNAQANHSPLLITAGQQARALITLQANLTNRDATRMPHPLVKWSYEPPRAEDVPLALARATHLATLPPKGPAFVSIPMDDWDAEVDDADVAEAIERQVDGRAGRRARRRSPRSPAGSRRRATRCWSPGPDIDAERRLGASRSRSPSASACRCSRARRPAAGGSASPRATRTSAASCRRRSARSPRRSQGHDLILVVGSSVFPYYPNIPGPLLPEGAELVEITSDPDEAARAPMGDAIVADVKLTLELLVAEVGESDRDLGESLPEPTRRPGAGPDHRDRRDARARAPRFPRTGSSCSSRRRRPSRCATSCGSRGPGSYYFGAGGGLGFGLAAAVGVQLAQPDRPVVCVLGEGSVQYAITALLERRRLRGAGHLPRPAQQRVRDPQVVREPRAGRGRARPRPAGARHRGDRRRLRGRRASGSSAADELREALGEAIASRRRPRAGRGRGRAGDVALLGGRDSLLERSSSRRRPSRPASPDAAPAWVAAGTPEPLRGELDRAARRRPRPRRAPPTSSATPPTPAPTGCFPKAVVMARDAADVAKVLAYGRRTGDPGHLPRRRHQPQRPGPERRHPRRRPPPLPRRRGARTTAPARG